MTACPHRLDHALAECEVCHATFEQIVDGDLAHPGRPTTERLWELRWRLVRLLRGVA